MMGVPEPPPGESLVLIVSWCLAVALCVSALSAPTWGLAPARVTRWSLVALAVFVQVGFHLFAPPRSAMESAGRLVFLWPALVVALVAGAAWWWRDAHRPGAP